MGALSTDIRVLLGIRALHLCHETRVCSRLSVSMRYGIVPKWSMLTVGKR